MPTARSRIAVLLVCASAFCLSNCRGSRLSHDAHVLFDSPQVQRIVEQMMQEKQRGPNYQRLANELPKQRGYDVWVFVRCKILFDGGPNAGLPYWKVEFENGPFKGKVFSRMDGVHGLVRNAPFSTIVNFRMRLWLWPLYDADDDLIT